MLKERQSDDKQQLALEVLNLLIKLTATSGPVKHAPTTITSAEDWNYVGRPTGLHRHHAEK